MSKKVTLRRSGTKWMLITDDMVLISSGKSDKEYMLRYIENWKQRNV